MRLFWCGSCKKSQRFIPTSEYEVLQDRKYRVYLCYVCKYRLHMEVTSA